MALLVPRIEETKPEQYSVRTHFRCPRPECLYICAAITKHTRKHRVIYLSIQQMKKYIHTPCPFLPVTLLTFDFFCAPAPQTLRKEVFPLCITNPTTPYNKVLLMLTKNRQLQHYDGTNFIVIMWSNSWGNDNEKGKNNQTFVDVWSLMQRWCVSVGIYILKNMLCRPIDGILVS